MTINNKNANQRLIKKKDQNDYFLTFVVRFAVECELTPRKQYLFVGI